MLLGSTSHYISQERHKIACIWVNPKLKPVALEEFTVREDSSLDLASWIKLPRGWSQEKTIDKVSDEVPSRKQSFQNHNVDLHHFRSTIFYQKTSLQVTTAGRFSALPICVPSRSTDPQASNSQQRAKGTTPNTLQSKYWVSLWLPQFHLWPGGGLGWRDGGRGGKGSIWRTGKLLPPIPGYWV